MVRQTLGARLWRRIRATDGWLCLALALALVAALPVLAGPGFLNTRAGGDSPFLLVRTQQMAGALRAGQFPVRWMPDANLGLGYGAFSYYAALPYYLAALLALAGCGLLWGVRLTQTLAFLLAGGATYALLRRLGRGPRVALVGSALYTFAPFHLVNVYVRGDALSEFAAMALVPAVLWALAGLRQISGLREVQKPLAGSLGSGPHRCSEAGADGAPLLDLGKGDASPRAWDEGRRELPGGSETSRRPQAGRSVCSPQILPRGAQGCARKPAGGMGCLVLAALLYAALVLSHNITALIASPFLALWLVCLAPWHSKARCWRFLAAGAAALGLGLVLSAWFWLPALGEQSLVQLGDQTTGYFHYAGHLRGLGAARPLVQWRLTHDYTIAEGRDPFSMGGVQALLALVGLAAAGWRAWKRRAGGEGRELTRGLCVCPHPAVVDSGDPLPNLEEGASTRGRRGQVGYSSSVNWGSADFFFVMLLFVATWLITPLSRAVWEHLPLLPYVQFPWRWLALQALAVAWLGARCLELAPADWARPLTLAACGLAVACGLGSLRPDYLPLREDDLTTRNLQLYEVFSGNIGGTVRYEYLPREMMPRPYTSPELLGRDDCPLALTGALRSCAPLADEDTARGWRLEANEEALLALPVTWFAGWQATVDGQLASVEPLAGLGWVGLRLSAGEHTVALHLGRTPLQKTAEAASAAGGLVALGLLGLAAGRGYAGRGWRRSGLVALAALALVAVWVAWLAPRGHAVASGEALWMDTERAPLLHPEPQGVRLGTAILREYTLGVRELAPGQALPVTLRWEGEWQGLEVRLVLVGLTAHQFDRAPIWNQVQAPIAGPEQRLELPIPPDAPPGLYAIRVRVFAGEKDQGLRNAEGLKLAKLSFEPILVTDAPHVTGREPRLASYGPSEVPMISLVGATLEQTSQRSATVHLEWRCERQAARNYQLSLRLARPDGSLVVMQDLPPMLGGYPTSLWQPGELLSDRIELVWEAAETLSPAATLSVVLYDVVTLQAVGEAHVPVE